MALGWRRQRHSPHSARTSPSSVAARPGRALRPSQSPSAGRRRFVDAVLLSISGALAGCAWTRIWEQAGDALAHSETWIVVGYSLPEYDEAVRLLFKKNSVHDPNIHIFDPNKGIANRFQTLLPQPPTCRCETARSCARRVPPASTLSLVPNIP